MVTARMSASSGPSFWGLRRTQASRHWRLAKNSCFSAASFHFPRGWCASAALSGKFDTTATRARAQVPRACLETSPKSTVIRAGIAARRKHSRAPSQTHKKPPNMSGFLRFPCWSLASQQIMAGGIFRRTYRRPSSRTPSFWGALAGCRFFVGSPDSSSSRYITGTLLIAISVPFLVPLLFNHLRGFRDTRCLESRSRKLWESRKSYAPPFSAYGSNPLLPEPTAGSEDNNVCSAPQRRFA
jgi:hypothetical protein